MPFYEGIANEYEGDLLIFYWFQYRIVSVLIFGSIIFTTLKIDVLKKHSELINFQSKNNHYCYG